MIYYDRKHFFIFLHFS